MNRKAGLEELTVEEIDDVLSVNLRAGFLTARSALPLMRGSSNASFVFAASGLATLVEPFTAPYSAAKAGTIALAKGLAKAHAPTVRANCIAPGAVDTAFLRGGSHRPTSDGDADFSVPGGKAQMLATIPMGRIAVVDDIVGPILFLLSDKARFMTGQTLYINGGRLMP
jgi:3-oxoacyl-[acyl-carrier protein] reductase